MEKVLIVGFTNNLGGVESLIYNYYQKIDRSVLQFDYLINVPDVPFKKEIEELGGKFFVIPRKTKDYFRYKKELDAFFRAHSSEYIAIWFNSNSMANLDYIISAKKNGIPKRIVHSHNTMETRGIAYNLFHLINKNKVKRIATDFWACSKEAGIFSFGDEIVDSDKFKVINNAIDIDRFKADDEKRTSWRRKIGASDSTVVYVCIGRLSYQKNHRFLLESFKMLHDKIPDSMLVLVGTGELKDEVKEKITALNLTNAVKMLGIQKDIPGILQAADVFVMPSHYEGLPVSGIEAQASGLPCLFSEKVTEQLKMSSVCEFIPIDDPMDWCSSMIDAAKKKRASCKEEIASAGFDINVEAEKLMKYLLQ